MSRAIMLLLLCVITAYRLFCISPQTRNIVARLPRLLCGSLEPVKENLKVQEKQETLLEVVSFQMCCSQ